MSPAWRPHPRGKCEVNVRDCARRFNDGTLDVETIEEVRKLCLAMIRKHSEMPLSALTTSLASRGFQRLSQSNVQEVLSTLVLDGLV